MAQTIKVPVTKGKGFIEIDVDALPEAVFAEVVLQGLKTLVNRGASKVTKATYPDEAELKAKAMEVAAEQVELLKTGKIKFTGAKSSNKVSGAVRAEAMRLARNTVKAAMKEAGLKVSHYDAKDITAMAKELLEGEEGAEIIKTATANIEAREAVPASAKLDFTKIAANPKKVAAAEAKKSKDGTLSKTQAGQVAKRSKKGGKPAQASA